MTHLKAVCRLVRLWGQASAHSEEGIGQWAVHSLCSRLNSLISPMLVPALHPPPLLPTVHSRLLLTLSSSSPSFPTTHHSLGFRIFASWPSKERLECRPGLWESWVRAPTLRNPQLYQVGPPNTTVCGSKQSVSSRKASQLCSSTSQPQLSQWLCPNPSTCPAT